MAGGHIDGPTAFQAYFSVSRETVAKLETYAGLLTQWQKTINLIAPSTLNAIWPRHFADSAQLVSLAPQTVSAWVDLGSGAGFPGLVAAILWAGREPTGSQTRFTLVESDARKCAFLREVVRQTGLKNQPDGPVSAVDILEARIENISTHSRVGVVDVVSARALAPLPQLLALSAPFFKPATVALLLKGRDAAAEVQAAHKDWRFEHALVPSLVEPGASIAVISKLQAHSG